MNNLNLELEKCKQIKLLIEKLSGVNDIAVKSNKPGFADLKKIYCFLAHAYTKANYTEIGSLIRDEYRHAQVIYNIKQFYKFESTGQLNFYSVYEKANYILRNTKLEYKEIDNKIEKLSNEKIITKDSYLSILSQIITKGHSIINRQAARILELEKLLLDK